MKELYRRLGTLCLLFLAILMFFVPRDGVFVRLYSVDMGKEYRSQYSPNQGLFGAQAAGGRFIRSVTPFRTIAGFIDSQTDKRLLTVEGELWPGIFTGAAAAPGYPPTAWREAGETYRKCPYLSLIHN